MNKVLRRGTSLLKTRPLDDQLDVSNLEKKYKFQIPTIYKVFSETYYLKLEDKGDLLFDGTIISKMEFEMVDQTGESLFFDQLFPLEFCMSTYREYEFWNEKGYMMIASGPSDGAILLSVEGENLDSIIYNDGISYQRIASNIFELFRSIIIIELDESNILYDNLYKEWYDKQWRLSI